MLSIPAPRRASASLLVILIASTTAGASPIEYRYSGVITATTSSTAIATGTPFSGTFVYDPTIVLPSRNIETATTYAYGMPGYGASSQPTGSAGLTLQIGGQTIPSVMNGLTVTFQFNNQLALAGQPNDSTIQISNVPVPSQLIPFIELTFSNPTQDLLNNGSVLPTSLNLTSFPIDQLTVTNQNSSVIDTGTVETFTIVPEPAYASLFCLAAIIYATRTRSRLGST